MLVAFGSLDEATVGSSTLGEAVILVELTLAVDGDGDGDEDDTKTADVSSSVSVSTALSDTSFGVGEGTPVGSATGVFVSAESGISGTSSPSCFAHSSALRFSGQQ